MPVSGAYVLWLAAHGWNIDIGINVNGSRLVRPLRWVGTVGAGRVGACTLLGPEGPDNPALSGVGVMVFLRPSPMMTCGLSGVGVLAVC
jgi:hypothetical protein